MDYFDYSENSRNLLDRQPDAWDLDIEEFLHQSQEQERRKLEEELQRIGRQLERRKRLHEEIIGELESKLDWYSSRLEKMQNQFSGRHGKREKLKDQIEEFYEELRREKRSNWHDRQDLEQERREILRELTEVKMDEFLTDLL